MKQERLVEHMAHHVCCGSFVIGTISGDYLFECRCHTSTRVTGFRFSSFEFHSNMSPDCTFQVVISFSPQIILSCGVPIPCIC